MIGTYVRRGLAAGLVGGLLAGGFGLAVGADSLDAAVALEAAAGEVETPADAAHDRSGEAAGISRAQQRVGLVAGTAIFGLGVGALFAVASAWAAGRVAGDSWNRSLKLGAVVVAALVVLPALKYPPNPPAVGDPASVAARTGLFIGLQVCGVLLAVAAWSMARQLDHSRLSRPVRQAVLGAGVVLAAGALLAFLPTGAPAGRFPADVLWDFRLASLGTQAVLYSGTAIAFGLMAARAESGRGVWPPEAPHAPGAP